MFKGSMPALITPFTNGEVDAKAFQDFVEWQISEGSHGLVPCGTTGESPTLSHDEHKRVVELCIEAANGRVPASNAALARAFDAVGLVSNRNSRIAASLISHRFARSKWFPMMRAFSATARATPKARMSSF